MKAIEFFKTISTSSFTNVISEPRLRKLKERLQEEGLFAKHSEKVTPENVANCLFHGLVLPSVQRGEGNAYIKQFKIFLDLRNDSEERPNYNPASPKDNSRKHTIDILTEILSDFDLIQKVSSIEIDLNDGSSFIQSGDKKLYGYFHGLRGNIGITDQYIFAKRTATINRSGLLKLAIWINN